MPSTRSLALFALATSMLWLVPAAHASAVQADTTARGSIAGEVFDAVSRKPLARARVLLRGDSLGVTTDLDGRFLLRGVPSGLRTVDIRRLGFAPQSQDVVVVANTITRLVTVALAPVAFRLSEVTVAPGSFSFLEGAPVARQALSRAAIEEAPFGEDLFRAMNRLPGLSSGDYGAHFSIRGGRADETLFLLDGLELYEPFHLKDFNEGALSIIDVDIVDGVELLTGGFPAHYGVCIAAS